MGRARISLIFKGEVDVTEIERPPLSWTGASAWNGMPAEVKSLSPLNKHRGVWFTNRGR